jgi:hypothetical protein
MLIPEWQGMALRAEIPCHLITMLGFIVHLTLRRTLFAAAGE